jgi:D-xylose transport system substrate-binding protein
MASTGATAPAGIDEADVVDMAGAVYTLPAARHGSTMAGRNGARRQVMRVMQVAVMAAALAMGGCGGGGSAPRPKPADEGPLKVGLLLDSLETERWKHDRDLFVARVEELFAKVEVRTGDGDHAKQVAAAKELLDAGVKALVVVPHDLDKAKEIVAEAAARKVPVISYDRLIRDADVAIYVSFDNVKVGRMQAEALLAAAPRGNYVLLGGAPTDNNAKLVREGQLEVLKPAIASGAVRVVADPWVDDWATAAAKEQMTAALKKTRTPAAVLASNDAIATGAAEALGSAKLLGKVALSGQDADLAACQRIVSGTQTMTVYKPIKALARMAAGTAVSLAKGEAADSLVKINNGLKDVPARLIEPISVDKTNIDVTVISDGYQQRDAVYQGKAN